MPTIDAIKAEIVLVIMMGMHASIWNENVGPFLLLSFTSLYNACASVI